MNDSDKLALVAILTSRTGLSLEDAWSKVEEYVDNRGANLDLRDASLDLVHAVDSEWAEGSTLG